MELNTTLIKHEASSRSIDEIDCKRNEIEQYFTHEQWKSMGEYEKKRFMNMRENYIKMREFG